MPRISHVTVRHNDRTATVVLTDGKRFSFAYKARNSLEGPQVQVVGDVAAVAKLVRLDEDEVLYHIVEKITTTLVAADILREALLHH
jgi:hypothetical protein